MTIVDRRADRNRGLALLLPILFLLEAMTLRPGTGIVAQAQAPESAGQPSLVFSTYLGGGSKGFFGIGADAGNYGYAVAVDTEGYVYVTGRTRARDFPVVRAAQRRHGGGDNDVFVARFTPDGRELVYSTYLGGRDVDFPYGIAIDDEGNAHVAGATYSSNFPTTDRAVQRRFGGGDLDGFVARFSPEGTLLYSTLLGGEGTDRLTAVAVDGDGNAYVTGSTNSPNFARSETDGLRDDWDGLLVKLASDGSRIVYASRFGGTAGEVDERHFRESGTGIALGSDGVLYISGTTDSPDFPVRDGAQLIFGGASDGFVVMMDAETSELIAGTYLGGTGVDRISGLALDPSGNVYVTGTSQALDGLMPPGVGRVVRTSPTTNDFPIRNAVQPNWPGSLRSPFVTEIRAGLSEIAYSTYLGTRGDASGTGVAVDRAGSAYVAGEVRSRDFPVVNPIQREDLPFGFGADAFVLKLSPRGDSIVFSTYLGAGTEDQALGIAVDASGDAYVTGSTQYGTYSDFPIVGAFQPERAGWGAQAFLSKIRIPSAN